MRAIALLVGVTIPALASAQAPSALTDTAYAPSNQLRAGRELVAYLIGASWCGPSNRPEVIAAMRRVKPLLAQQAAARGAAFSATGVALDWEVEKGMGYLAKLGPLDEATAGRNWLNSMAVDRIWRDSLTAPMTPQLIVVEQDVALGQRIMVSPARVILRVVGGDSISTWVARGAPVPFTSSH